VVRHGRTARSSTLLAFVVVACIVAVTGASVLGARRFADERIRADVREDLASTSSLVSVAASERVARIVGAVDSIATDPAVESSLGRSAVVRRDVVGRLAAIEGVRLGVVVAPDSTLLEMAPRDPGLIGRRFAHRDWYRGVQERSPYLSEAFRMAAFDAPRAVSVAARVVRSGEVVAILAVAIEAERFEGVLRRAGSAVGLGRLVIADQSGAVVAGERAPATWPAERRAIDGAPGWDVVAAVDPDVAFRDVDRVRATAAVTMFIVCALLLVLSAVLAANARRLRRARRVEEREAQAFELNDTVVQRLAVAHMAISLGRIEEAAAEIDASLDAGRRMVGALAGERRDFVRDNAAGDAAHDVEEPR
jgi:hypothetical protein